MAKPCRSTNFWRYSIIHDMVSYETLNEISILQLSTLQMFDWIYAWGNWGYIKCNIMFCTTHVANCGSVKKLIQSSANNHLVSFWWQSDSRNRRPHMHITCGQNVIADQTEPLGSDTNLTINQQLKGLTFAYFIANLILFNAQHLRLIWQNLQQTNTRSKT